MGFKCGILGLSNVGKSTLFNALTATAAAQASNYPFSTIEPNVGEVMVPDPRLDVLAKLAKSARSKPTRLTFVDIAGLVSGASKGEGLGNQFLAHIREVDAIAHVVRCFVDPNVAHVAGALDPIADIETIETELMLADLDSLERRVDGLSKKAKGNDKDAVEAMLMAREPGSGLVHEHWGDNIFLETNFEVDISSALDAPIKVTREISTARQCMSPLEGRGVVANFDHRLDQLTLYSTAQMPHITRSGLAECLGMEQARIRIISPDVGGGFGYKGILLPEEVCLSWLTMHSGH